jgi:hypothetical protein
MARRPCIEAHCQRLALPGKARCSSHNAERSRARDRRRGTRQQRGYDAAYERARAALLASGPACRWCGAPATTADHYPPLATGHWSGSYLPACRRCNNANVAAKHWTATHQ